jgi:hypothetical protein
VSRINALSRASADLVHRARLRPLVVSPAQQARAVAEAAGLDVVGRYGHAAMIP